MTGQPVDRLDSLLEQHWREGVKGYLDLDGYGYDE